MQSTLAIKDLSATKELDRSAMSAVQGGLGNQANATTQFNLQEMFAPVAVANGATFGSGSVIIQVDSQPKQTASNESTSVNEKSLNLFDFLRAF